MADADVQQSQPLGHGVENEIVTESTAFVHGEPPQDGSGPPKVTSETTVLHEKLDHALIAKFSNGRPHVSAVERDFRASWKLEGQMIISDLEDLFNEGVLRCLCQPFGRAKRTRCAYARCCLEIDLAKVLPAEIWIDIGNGHGRLHEIVYVGNLKYCSKCSLHGHMLSECRKMRMRPQERKEEKTDQVLNVPETQMGNSHNGKSEDPGHKKKKI
uniref:Uncharacterized protein n=1 Tax=Kalanchoe fedtschenkoi TaxID=63787 RepID=A0A7N0UYW5_KALFE